MDFMAVQNAYNQEIRSQSDLAGEHMCIHTMKEIHLGQTGHH